MRIRGEFRGLHRDSRRVTRRFAESLEDDTHRGSRRVTRRFAESCTEIRGGDMSQNRVMVGYSVKLI